MEEHLMMFIKKKKTFSFFQIRNLNTLFYHLRV